jgi:hypothetical protein
MSDDADRVALAWGLLWHMKIDRSDPSLLLASEARMRIGGLLTKEQKAAGIQAARDRMKLMRVEPPLIDQEVIKNLWEKMP